MEKDIFEEERKLINERNKSVKHGNNVVHLKHISEFTENDLKEFSENLSAVNLELSSFNSSGITVASFDEFNFITYLSLSQPLIIEFIKDISTNAAWDIIKQTIVSVRKKVIGKKYYRVTSKGAEEKEMTFGIKFHLDNNTGFDFELKGDVTDKLINECLDKALDFVKSQKVNPEYKHPTYLKYSKKEKKWISIDVLKEIRKRNEKK